MALIEVLINGGRLASIGRLELDASISESHEMSSTITSHAIESGAQATDHIIQQPRRITIEGIVSNTPLSFIPVSGVGGLGNDFVKRSGLVVPKPSPLKHELLPIRDRVEAALSELERVWSAGETIDVYTTLRSYKGYAIESIVVRRDNASGNALPLTISLREIARASILNISLDPDPITASNKASKSIGKKSTPAANADVTAKSQELTALQSGAKYANTNVSDLF